MCHPCTVCNRCFFLVYKQRPIHNSECLQILANNADCTSPSSAAHLHCASLPPRRLGFCTSASRSRNLQNLLLNLLDDLRPCTPCNRRRAKRTGCHFRNSESHESVLSKHAGTSNLPLESLRSWIPLRHMRLPDRLWGKHPCSHCNQCCRRRCKSLLCHKIFCRHTFWCKCACTHHCAGAESRHFCQSLESKTGFCILLDTFSKVPQDQ